MKLIETDDYLANYISDQELSKKRAEAYETSFKEIKKLTGLTPTELVKQAKQQQKQPYKDEKGEIVFFDMEDRKITKHLTKYNNYLKNETKNSDLTRNKKIGTIRAFLKHYNVDLPRKPKIKKYLPPRLNKEEIPNIEDVRKGVNAATNLRNKAIIMFILTSGIRVSDVVRFTISDFLEATKEYHNGTIENLLEQDPENIIPCWEFMPKKTEDEGNIALTFNTPEAVEYIFNYLNERKEKGYSIEPETPLFRSLQHKSFFLADSVVKMFNKLNKAHFDGRKDREGYAFFRSHNIRKLFSSLIKNNIGKASMGVTNESKIDVVSVMEGHKAPGASIKDVYEYADVEIFKEYYVGLVEFLSIRDTDTHHYKTDEFIKMETQFNQLKEEMKEYEPLIQREKEKNEKEELISQIVDDDNLREILNYIHSEREDIDIKNIDLLREIVKLKEEKDLSKWKENEIKKVIHEIIDKIKPIDKMRVFENTFLKNSHLTKKLTEDKDLLEKAVKEIFEQFNTPFIKKEKT